MHARKHKEGGNQMEDKKLLFDHKSHVLYSKPVSYTHLTLPTNREV